MFHLYSWHHLPWFRLRTSNFVSLEVTESGKNWEGKGWDFFLDNPGKRIHYVYIYILPFTIKIFERYGYRIALATYLGVRW